MGTSAPSFRIDPLYVFATSVSVCLAALLFLLAVLADVSLATAASRAIVGWVVLSLIGLGIARTIRWVLNVPAPVTSPRFDVTLPPAGADDIGR